MALNKVLLLWFSLSLSGSLAALTLIFLKPVLRRLSKTWNYYIWLLVLFRLLIPFTPDASLVGSLFREAGNHFFLQHSVSLEDDKLQKKQNDLLPPPDVTVSDNNAGQKLTESLIPSFMAAHALGAIWLAIGLFLLMRKLYAYNQFVNAVKKENRIISEGEPAQVFRKVCFAMGIRKRILVYTNPFIKAPMLIGIIRPGVILPARSFDSQELFYIYQHELTHYRRMDFLYKWLAEITVCLHWFNPMVYWVRKQINRSCELSCDEMVISGLNDMERKAYGGILLNSIIPNTKFRSNIAALSLNEDGQIIKERLCAIMKYKPKSRRIAFFSIILTVILLCGTIFAGAYTQKNIENISLSTSDKADIMNISNKDLASGGKISLGSQKLFSGTSYQVILTWTGNSSLSVLITSSDDMIKSYIIKKGHITALTVDNDGDYTIIIKNEGQSSAENINGSITAGKNEAKQGNQNSNKQKLPKTKAAQTVVYESVMMYRYKGKDGHPYIHDIRTNHTAKKITGSQRGMLAFDKKGNPLKIHWHSLDSESGSTYFYLYKNTENIAPGETDDVFGGWSLNPWGGDLAVKDIAYILYCDKEITFEDGTKWKNPNYKKWLSTYKGKKVDVDVLENYYPYKQKITFQ